MTNNSEKWSWVTTSGAATHFPSLRTDQKPNVHMFVQDVPSGVMPLRFGRGNGDNYKVEISGSSGDRDRAIAVLRSIGRREGRSLEAIVADAISEIARNLSWSGRATHEIVRDPKNDAANLLRGFTPKRLFNARWYYIQIVPKMDREIWKKAFVFLHRKDVWAVYMPKSLGGYRGYGAILRKLFRVGDSSPRFWKSDIERHALAGTTYFSFQDYRREVDLFECRITRRWGWNRRDFSGRNWTEFTQFYRTVTFKWAQAVLREHIVVEINVLLKRLNIQSEVQIFGVRPSADILRLRNAMCEGTISYAKAFEQASS